MLDRQAAFEKAVTGLWRQGKWAFVRGDCRYRTENGLKCAVGQLIPDDCYRIEMENLSPVFGGNGIGESIVKAVGGDSPEDGKFLCGIQGMLHDGLAIDGEPITAIFDAARRFAIIHNLDTSFLKELENEQTSSI